MRPAWKPDAWVENSLCDSNEMKCGKERKLFRIYGIICLPITQFGGITALEAFRIVSGIDMIFLQKQTAAG